MVSESTQVTGRVKASVYSTESLPDSWDDLQSSEQLDALDDIEPEEEVTDTNTTTIGMHEYFAENIDPDQTIDLDADYLALGDDDTSPSPSNRSLNNEFFRTTSDSGSVSSNEVTVTTTVGSNQGNGNTIREVGLFTDTNGGANERMLNHSAIGDIQKDNTRTVKFDITLKFTAA